MTRQRRPRWWRVSVAGGMIGLMLCLSGCVYLRLLQLKRQLADFDHNFVLSTASGLHLRCLEPVLLTSDLRWLGFEPATIRRLGTSEQWHIRWVTQPAPTAAVKGTFEIAFDLTFSAGRLSALTLADKYFGLLPKDVVIAAIKSLGSGNVDRKQRSMQSSVALPASASPMFWPDRKMVAAILGPPTEEHQESGRIVSRFHCISADPSGKGKDIQIKLVFDAITGKLLQTSGQLPVGNINLEFTPPGEGSPEP
ncbi:MAG: hypothetical protein RIQ93_532 [Verrucomicrobiota bacterium]|jgi:hypothetical protein